MSKINIVTFFQIEFESFNDLMFFNEQLNKAIKISPQYFAIKNKYIAIIKLPMFLNKFIPFINEFGAVKKLKIIEIAYIKEYGKIIKL